MAYPRPTPYDARSSHDSERSRSSWDTMQRPHYPAMHSPSHPPIMSPGLFEPESESSDVSDNPGEDYHTRIQSTFPTALPPPPSKYTVESVDTIDARLRELQRVEDLNIRKQEHLKGKRARKDDRIRRKREAQDLKIKAIMDARARRDDRITRRRKQEDDAFERFDKDLEQEENDLRRRQKRLKRGLPVDDMTGGSRISSASMSPPAPTYSNIPPPPKRHQTSHPGQNDSPIISTPRPVLQNTPAAPNSSGPNPPPYAFLQSSHPPPSAPYGRSPTISSHSPPSTSTPFQPTPRSHQSVPEPSPYNMNGHPPSPHMSRPPVPPPGPVLNTALPPRVASSYDTRPPPPTPPVASGFATINTPPASGFAPINPRNTATPPAPANVPLAKNVDHERINGHTRPYVSEGTPTSGSGNAGSKRTPSTTHPYQMSEAFANRHHHCEKTDQLNRGIWTSYGPGGTKDHQTGPIQEMYLRCNHDGCRRIDWRTVHGLQCHIVKNHEQKKGTIGSLEKALDRYGVPVAEIEAYEREHGEGSGGTMADPKNLKLKTKRESHEKSDGVRRSYGQPPPSAVYRAGVPMPTESSTHSYQDSPASIRSLPRGDTEDSESESRITPVSLAAKPADPPRSGFAAVNGQGQWSTVPGPRLVEHKDHDMKDAPRSPHLSGTGSVPPRRDGNFWRTWPDTQGSTKPEPQNNAPLPNQTNTPFHGAPMPMPVPTESAKVDIPHHGQSVFVPHVSAPAVQPIATPVTDTTPKVEKTVPAEGSREIQLNTSQVLKPNIEDRSLARKVEILKDSETAGSITSQTKPAPQSAVTSANEAATRQQESKELEKPKVDVVEPTRPEPKSPENNVRRLSTVGGRRVISRRSSTAANKMEKEREEAEAKAKAGAEAEKEKKLQEKEEHSRKVEAEQDQEVERDEENDRDEDSDDPDTITAVSSVTSKDRDKDKDREGKENKTTPRRQANGRFVRKR